uniref:CD3 gamma/delta subunit Ig-like domain-containing protein n=1 Tax=Cyprinus carpio carpio TaxID=630221 RepID=A0A8C1AKV4_CYPCA
MILMSFMFLLAAAVNPAQSQGIQEIKSDGVIILCSGGEDGKVKWFKDNNNKEEEIKDHGNLTYEVKADQGIVKGFYRCEYEKTDPYEKKKYVFFLRVQVCENCYELSRLRAAAVILGDVLFTGGVIFIIYRFTTKNSGGTQKRASNSRAVNPPPPPNPDYAPLDPKTRNNAVYSGIR